MIVAERRAAANSLAADLPDLSSGHAYILRGIAAGRSVRYCVKRGRRHGIDVPSRWLFLRDMHLTDDLCSQYVRARQMGIEARIDSMRDIIAACDSSDAAMMHAQVARARLTIDTIKWEACKLIPRLYGDRSAVEHVGNLTLSVVTGVPRLTGDIRDAVLVELPAGGDAAGGDAAGEDGQPALPAPRAESREHRRARNRAEHAARNAARNAAHAATRCGLFA